MATKTEMVTTASPEASSGGKAKPSVEETYKVQEGSMRSSSSLTLQTSNDEKVDHCRKIPDKQWAQPCRGFRFRILIVYRFLFSLVGLFNIGILVAVLLVNTGSEWLGTITAANLVVAIVIRQDTAINALYKIFCSAPKSLPVGIRRYCAKIYHLGGVHSAAGFCATLWLVESTLRSTILRAQNRAPESLATLVISWLLSALCCVIVTFAYPAFRRRYHNTFEWLHRFLGWTTLALFWVRTVLSAYDSSSSDYHLGQALVRSPGLWMLVIATLSVASSWFFLRRVPVEVMPMSDHAVMLNFNYTQMMPPKGSFQRVSTRPLLEWHSFATYPQPKANGLASSRGYSMLISNAGDWTKACIQKPPSHLWVRGIPVCGVMHITHLFRRVVFIATGSGIAPMLGFISSPSCPTQLIWSTPDPEKTFGKPVLDVIHRTIPNATIHDTRLKGRPDLVTMGYNLAHDFGAEAVMVIANEKVTKKVVYGLETRGITAYGAIWDS
ncbi:hypothetical protein HIM_11956 [Hirsutella minnesotensis 3608]|uniref:AMP-dependent synthetase/ligase domain-containing protein n=1 Tax=Hirsutella minnesotensis 3608 TaxID=1043627 RepID=A0A0F7ZIK3_9HYPO|nr:hypothetical protein HIM_11956 [Hirsutella minnesotensis 3608]